MFDLSGRRLGHGVRPIQTWRPAPDFVEQSGDDIWSAVCAAVRDAVAEAGAVAITGIGFDATCSLVVRDAQGGPVSVSRSGEPERDVIVWMDHRALEQTARINRGGSKVLDYVGGTMSPEMETPKLLWLKENRPGSWERAARFFDLPDFLTWRATGSETRSLCSTVCKWTYLGHEQRWDADYFRSVGLGELADEGFARIGTTILPPGTPAGGLTEQAAGELGLAPGTPVGTSEIDAHAGGLGVIGAALDGEGLTDATMRAAAGADRRHVELPHDGFSRSDFRAGGVGAVLLGDAARAVAERGRPVGDRRADRPHHHDTRSRRRVAA